MLIGKTVFAQTNAVLFKLDDETKNIFREATVDKWFKKDAFTSALLGGLLGGLAAVMAVFVADLLQRKKERRADDEFDQRVLNAIQIELKMLLEIYDSGAAGKIKDLKDGELFPFWLHFSQKHFVVFESNASHIGKIDPELAGQIIMVYELLKVFVENMGVNGRYVADRDQTNWALRFNPTDKNLLERRDWIESCMVNEAKRFKQLDARIRVELNEFFQRFDKLKQQCCPK